jgi:predicted MFS family arabinose efflux permease
MLGQDSSKAVVPHEVARIGEILPNWKPHLTHICATWRKCDLWRRQGASYLCQSALNYAPLTRFNTALEPDMAKTFLRALTLSRGPMLALGAVGVIWGTFAAMVPVIKAQAQASDAAFGTALLGSAAGGMVAMYIAPKLSEALGRFVLLFLAVLSVLVLQLPVFVTSTGRLLPVMAAMGIAVASLDINANLRVSQLEDRHGLHLMNLNHAMFSLCFGAAAVLVAALRHSGWSIAQILPLMGGGVLVLGALSFEGRDPVVPDTDEEATPAMPGLPWRPILLVAVMLFVSFMGENAIESWSALFLERELGGEAGQGGFGPSMLGFTMAGFRLLGHLGTQRLGEARVVFWSGVLGVVGALVLSQAQTQPIALFGIAVTAIGMAVIVPTATSLLGKRVSRRHRNVAISRAWMLGFVGFFVGPSTIGFVSDHFGLRVAFLCVAGMLALIIPAVLALTRVRN